MKKNIKGLIRRELLKEQFGGYNGLSCESGPGGCECTEPVFGIGDFHSTPNGGNQSQDLADCINADNCCERWDCYSDGAGVCESVDNFAASFSNETDCLAAHPAGCTQTEDDYSCVLRKNIYVCVVTPGGSFTGPTAQNDCNTAVSNNTSPCEIVVDREYDCDIENCKCIVVPSGSFTGPTAEADCNTALANPNHECCCIDCDPQDDCDELMNDPQFEGCCEQCGVSGGPLPLSDPCAPYCKCCEKYDCVGKRDEGGNSNMVCVVTPSGPFDTMADCQAALQDPTSKCNEGDPGNKFDCEHGTGCYSTPSGPYSSMEECEESRDDHYNMGTDFCECDCPGQPAGCDSTPLISPIMNNNGELGPLGQPLDLQQLVTSAYRNRMAPCGPSYNAPLGRVKHDCSFWEYISTKKLPIDVWNDKVMVGAPNSTNAWHMANGQYPWTQGTGVHAGASNSYCSDGVSLTELDCTSGGGTWLTGTQWITNQGNILNPLMNPGSATPHPRWQRKIEAKIAYVRCLRQACCGATEWPNDGDVFIPSL
tara:strand:+ start:2998 stop:4608 length:1611 start_codon:yes stop_codon:yes gene_type:complete